VLAQKPIEPAERRRFLAVAASGRALMLMRIPVKPAGPEARGVGRSACELRVFRLDGCERGADREKSCSESSVGGALRVCLRGQ
jgi:hypothetical protein